MLQKDYNWLPKTLAYRYASTYGSLCLLFLKGCHAMADLGQQLAADLYEKEVIYLLEHEWAKTAEDILWRRTKCGLQVNNAEVTALQNFIQQQGDHT